MPIKQSFFELNDIRPLQSRPWIPLRQIADECLDPEDPDVVRVEQYTAVATAAVHKAKRSEAEKLGWSDLDVNSHRPAVEDWGYAPSDVFRNWKKELGINLVIDQLLEHEHRNIWHLHPDLIVALRLLQEGDSWFRPEEGWAEVARLKRNDKGEPTLFEIRAEFLGDYLAARGMALYCSSYRERIAVTVADPGYSPGEIETAEEGRDRREMITTATHYPDPPGQFWTRGCLWRTEWVEPATLSTRVGRDRDPHTATFALNSDGTRVNADQLAGAIAWLHFEPTLVSTLLRHRSGKLHWFTQETGALGATSHGVHFGVNDLGLVTVLAKDVGNLEPWEQRLWSAHNVTPEGGVSAELFAAQMEVNPAATVAPEARLKAALETLDDAFHDRFKARLLRDHGSVPDLLRRTHRFRAADPDGLPLLAKDVTRLVMERVDVDAVANAVALAKGERKIASLKAIEKLVAKLRDETAARAMMAPLFGIYDLRLADAHLGSSLADSGRARVGVDETMPAAMQGRALLAALVATLGEITAVLAQKGPSKA